MQDVPERGMPYTMWMVDDTPVGAVMELPAKARAMGAPSHWLPYIGTGDVDATIEQALSLGGQVLVPTMDIPGVGQFAVLQDPQGASFAVFTSATTGGVPATGFGSFSWHELLTTDPVAAFTFYNALFGWEKTSAMDMGPMGVYQMFGTDERAYGGMFKTAASMPAPPHWLCYVKVADAKATAASVTATGGEVVNGPMEVPGGDWIVQVQDPQGATIAFHSSKLE